MSAILAWVFANRQEHISLFIIPVKHFLFAPNFFSCYTERNQDSNQRLYRQSHPGRFLPGECGKGGQGYGIGLYMGKTGRANP